jgi:hypothetical protein
LHEIAFCRASAGAAGRAQHRFTPPQQKNRTRGDFSSDGAVITAYPMRRLAGFTAVFQVPSMLRVPVRHGLLFLLVSGAALAQPAVSAPGAPTEASPAAPTGLPAATAGGTAPPLQACATKAFDSYATDMSVWERQWAEGVVSVRPDFTTAAIARANAHNSALQRDGFRIHYLAANAPENLDLEESIAAMRLFDWTPEQEQALRLGQAEYAGVADAAERDRQAADAQPKAEELEAYFEETFTDNMGAAYARKLGEVLQKGNGALEQCRKEHPAPPKADKPVDLDAQPAAPAAQPMAPVQPAAPAAPSAQGGRSGGATLRV